MVTTLPLIQSDLLNHPGLDPNSAAMLFTSAKITHLNSPPQGQPQRDERTVSMVTAMRDELFGSCTNHGECEAVCPKQIPLEFIGKMNRDLVQAFWHNHREPLRIPSVAQHPAVEGSHHRLDEHVDARLKADISPRVQDGADPNSKTSEVGLVFPESDSVARYQEIHK